MTKTTGSALALAVGLMLASAATAQTVVLTGPTGRQRTLTAAELAAMPHQTAMVPAEKGPAKAYDGVPLTLLLQSVGAPSGKTLRGPAFADVVVVTASDGYRVVLALAETDAGMRTQTVLLADRSNGAALGPTEGPFRLVVEGDLRPARAARMVTAIAVRAVP
jgi:hypothetical protein